MILDFDCKETEKVSKGEYTNKWSFEVRRVAMRRLDYLNVALNLDDLKIPPSNRLHALKGELKGFYAISINMQWRLISIWENGNAFRVKITDYH